MNKIKMFGALRKFADEQGHLQIELSEGMTVSKFKTALKNTLSAKFSGFDSKLIDESAIANNTEILVAEAIINTTEEIAVLPPVCGG
jgi:molybdopterin converting factor small subunit